MKLTLETKDKTVVIELSHDEQTVTSIFDELLIPAVLALGYYSTSIDDYIAESAILLDDKDSNTKSRYDEDCEFTHDEPK